ncbi:DUF6263 family protein [Tundrisphaera lichenicola]|uniref:DUF6263 family protein n=1 Tax=Tundrisphaera lichenicola TaxID=2029860 RepID=UPI003EBFDCD9
MKSTSPLALLRASLMLGLVLIGGTSPVRAEATKLRWKFKPGEVLRYTMVQTQSMTTKVKRPTPQEFKQGFTLTLDQTWKVKSVDDSGVATLTQTIDRIRTTAELPQGKVAFDSKEKKDIGSLAGPLFKMLVGAEFTFKMDGRGAISDIQLPEPMLATLRSKDEPAGAQGQFSEAGLKNMISQIGLFLPEGPVEPGATWDRKLTIPAGPEGQTRGIEQNYAYRGPEVGKPGKTAGIELKIKFDPMKPDPEVPVTIKSQESSGRFEFDNEAGRIATSRITEKVELAGSIEGQEISQAGETTTALTLSGSEPK